MRNVIIQRYKMKFNINEEIKCELTLEGEKVLKRKNKLSYENNYNPRSKVLVEQLWEVMNIFGSEIFNGGPQLIKNNTIEL